MRTINPYFTAIRQADKIIGDSLKTKARRKKRIKGAVDYLNAVHCYKLVANQQDLGEKKTMTGREAFETNKAFSEIFRDEIGKEIDAGVPFGKTISTLKRWVLAKHEVEM
jgi:hypothetical protein